MLVILDFDFEPNGEVVASSTTYADFVGVLTGVGSDLRGCSIPRGSRGAAVVEGASANDLSCRRRVICASPLRETTVIGEDLITAELRPSTNFIIVPNADVDDDVDSAGPEPREKTVSKAAGKESKTSKKAPLPPTTAVEKLIENANKQNACARRNYRSLLRRRAKWLRQSSDGGGGSEDPGSSKVWPRSDLAISD